MKDLTLILRVDCQNERFDSDPSIRHHLSSGKRLNSLFRTLLQRLMTAQIRVHDVDLSELGLETESNET